MAIDTVVEEVADNLEEMAEATRRINTNSVAFFVGGAVVGAAIGFYFGYRFNKEKIKAEAFKQSEEEVAKIREEYQRKVVAAQPKPSLEEKMKEAGYTSEEIKDNVVERPLPAPVPVYEPPRVTVLDKDKSQGWDYAEELKSRFANKPYVIHQDEYSQNENGYNQVTYTYYAADDVLVDEENGHPLPHGDIVVGVENLKFGHGTDDDDVVFVRNDRLELEMEICRSPLSYEQEVLGIGLEEPDEPTDSD
jgi:hypothetical protein